jgi:hypothetical protein
MYLLQFLNKYVVLDLSVSTHFGNAAFSKQNYFVELFKELNGMSCENSRFILEFAQEKFVENLFRNVFI